MPAKTIRNFLDVSTAKSDHQRTVFHVANLCAGLFRQADWHVSVPVSPVLIAQVGNSTKTGLLAAADELRNLLLKLPQGRESLRDLGFDPFFEQVEGE